MILLATESQQSRAQVLALALDYFGPDGVGLSVKSQDATSVRLEGGGGYVVVHAQMQPDSRLTAVELESREWEHYVEQFLDEV